MLRCHSSATPSHSRSRRRSPRHAGDLGGGDETRDLGRGGRRGVAAGLLPALLRGRRAHPHQGLRRAADAVPQVGAPQLVRQDQRERRLVELDVALVRLPVDPRVLRERAVRLLLALEQPGHGPVGRGPVAGGQQAGHLVVEVTRPHEVVAAAAGVGVDREAPRQRQRRDERTPERLVLVGLHRHHRDVVLRPQPTGEDGRDRAQRVEVPMPLAAVGGRAVGEARGHAGPRRLLGRRVRAGEPERQRVGGAASRPGVDAQLAGLQDVAVRRGVVVEVEPPVGLEVGPAVAGADEPVGRAEESGRGDQGGVRVALTGQQRHVPRCAGPRRGVAAGRVADRRVVEDEHPVVAGLQRGEPDPHEDGRPPRVGDVGLGDPVAAGRRRVDLLVDQRPGIHQPHLLDGVLALAVDERAPVGHRELQGPDLSGVAAGEVDLAQRPAGQRVPDLRVRARRRCRDPACCPWSSSPTRPAPRAPPRPAADAAAGAASARTVPSSATQIPGVSSASPLRDGVGGCHLRGCCTRGPPSSTRTGPSTAA